MMIGQSKILMAAGVATTTTVDSDLEKYTYYLTTIGKALTAHKCIKYAFPKVIKFKMA